MNTSKNSFNVTVKCWWLYFALNCMWLALNVCDWLAAGGDEVTLPYDGRKMMIVNNLQLCSSDTRNCCHVFLIFSWRRQKQEIIFVLYYLSVWIWFSPDVLDRCAHIYIYSRSCCFLIYLNCCSHSECWAISSLYKWGKKMKIGRVEAIMNYKNVDREWEGFPDIEFNKNTLRAMIKFTSHVLQLLRTRWLLDWALFDVCKMKMF